MELIMKLKEKILLRREEEEAARWAGIKESAARRGLRLNAGVRGNADLEKYTVNLLESGRTTAELKETNAWRQEAGYTPVFLP